MLHLFLDSRPWFRAKSRGYGTGLPIAWQGWVLLAAHTALLAGVIMLMQDHPIGLTIAAVVVGLAPMPLYQAKTEGGWRWRWGNRKDSNRKDSGPGAKKPPRRR